nr:MAG TPA: hypothetical protein [Caudoviricetes sp.]
MTRFLFTPNLTMISKIYFANYNQRSGILVGYPRMSYGSIY